jgi:hypothetical protein
MGCARLGAWRRDGDKSQTHVFSQAMWAFVSKDRHDDNRALDAASIAGIEAWTVTGTPTAEAVAGLSEAYRTRCP